MDSIVQLVVLVKQIFVIYFRTVASFFKKPKKKSIKNQNVLITGAGHGLGREMVFKFAQQGANLILVDINQANNEKVRDELLSKYTKGSIKAFAYTADIRSDEEVAKLAAKLKSEIGDVDILVNNAGIVSCRSFSDLSREMVERTFQVNTFAHFWTIKHFLPAMIRNGRGHIVAISSIAGLIGNKYLTDYCASKFAIVGLMEALDREIHAAGANRNIRLTTVCPVSMTTGMFQTFTTKFSWLLPVLGAEDVAKAVVGAVRTNKTLIAVPKITMFFYRLSSLIPTKVNYLVQDYLDYGVKPHSN